MELSEICNVIREWIAQSHELGKVYRWVQIFENKGAIMGCSNPHPHCQIWASDYMPNEAAIKDSHFREYFQKYGRPLLLDYAEKEVMKNERIISQNDDWLAVVPYWAIWPFEVNFLYPR